MKALKITLRIFAFLSTYIVPIALLGIISPLTRGELGDGLTGLGYIAIASAIIVCAIKVFGKVLKMKKGWKRALIISAFPISIWLVVMLGVNYIQALIMSISDYWLKVGIFIIIGRIFTIIEECIDEFVPQVEAEDKTKNSEV